VTFDPNPVFDIPISRYKGDAFAPASMFNADWGSFDVDHANSRFIMMAREDAEGESESAEIRFVVNWFEELKAKIPPLE